MSEPARSRGRAVFAGGVTVLCGVVVWLALALPRTPDLLTWGWMVRIPAAGLVLVVVVVLLPRSALRPVGVVVGVIVGALVVLKVLNAGFVEIFDRNFDPVHDWALLPPGFHVLGDSVGQTAAVAVAAGAGLVTVALLVLVPACLLRVLRALHRHRVGSLRTAGVLAVAWVLCAVLGAQLIDVPVASATSAELVYGGVRQVRADMHDHAVFADAIAHDRFADVPGDQMLTALRGQDVLVVFVESYGRVAVQGSSFSRGVDTVLDRSTQRLRDAGYGMRSGFLTSPTFGAGSWLAHSTLQSGLWVDSQERYDQLVDSHRLTLTGAFARAGWRTVFDCPAVTGSWPQGSQFYGYDKLYDANNVGYEGPRFSWATMPDQYTMQQFWKRELAPTNRRPVHRRPVMAEIELVSSHHPWAPLPHMVPWSRLGNGSVFEAMAKHGKSPEEVFSDPDAVRSAYAQSIRYSLRSVVSFLLRYHDPHLVVVMLGDHQPHHYVSGLGVGHDVPISIIASDPRVLARTDAWHWQDGLHPAPDAPVWRMDAFRNRFLTAFGPHG